jgi:hypothetical protein
MNMSRVKEREKYDMIGHDWAKMVPWVRETARATHTSCAGASIVVTNILMKRMMWERTADNEDAYKEDDLFFHPAFQNSSRIKIRTAPTRSYLNRLARMRLLMTIFVTTFLLHDLFLQYRSVICIWRLHRFLYLARTSAAITGCIARAKLPCSVIKF